jgi:hypothetical protein
MTVNMYGDVVTDEMSQVQQGSTHGGGQAVGFKRVSLSLSY